MNTVALTVKTQKYESKIMVHTENSKKKKTSTKMNHSREVLCIEILYDLYIHPVWVNPTVEIRGYTVL